MIKLLLFYPKYCRIWQMFIKQVPFSRQELSTWFQRKFVLEDIYFNPMKKQFIIYKGRHVRSI